MSIIMCPHMGHSFLLPAAIHQTPGNRFILLILAGTVPAAAAIRPMRAPAPGSPPACLDRRCTLSPRLQGAAELKFVLTKCRPLSIFNLLNAFDVCGNGQRQRSANLLIASPCKERMNRTAKILAGVAAFIAAGVAVGEKRMVTIHKADPGTNA